MRAGLTDRSDHLCKWTLAICALFLVAVGVACPTHAQEESVVTLTVAGFEFSGNQAISSDALAEVLGDAVGKELTLTGLVDQASRITRFYREHGFVVARAFLPQQEVTNGIVRIEVLEGRYGAITLDNTSRLRDQVAQDYLASLQSNDPIKQSALERTTLLLNDLPGVHAETTFRVGQTVGTSDIIVSLTDSAPWSVSLSTNNHAEIFQSQLGASWSNPRGYGDRLSVSLGPLASGSLGGNATYSAPIGGQGLRASLSLASRERRQSLGSTPIVTSSRTRGVRLDYPVVRTQSANTRIGLGFDSLSERRTIGAVLSDESRVTRKTVEWQGDRSRSDGGSRIYSLSATQGTLRLAPQAAADADAASAQTTGAFVRLNARAVVRRPVWNGLTINLEIRGQAASKNLHSSEKMGLGGVGGVRAYSAGAASGDQGWLVRTELQRGFRWPAWGLEGSWTAFADIGGVHVNRVPWPGSGGENVTSLSGIGGGLTIARGNWLVEMLNAYPIGSNPIDGSRDGRLWLRATWQY